MTARILMATVATLALTVPAMAQDQAQPLPTEQTANPAMEQSLQDNAGAKGTVTEQNSEMTSEEPAPPAGMKFIQVQEDAQFLANDEVIGADVVNGAGEEVGEIADLVMDQDQKLAGVVLSVGGFMGLGDKWVAVPVDQIAFPTGDQPARLLVEVTAEQLENAPDFMTKDAIEAQEAAEQAQRQAMQQQVPPPATSPQ